MRALSIVLAAAERLYMGQQADLDEQPELDDDRDGVVAKDDSDDNDPDRFPGNEGIWYDGVDGDCLGGDDFDADADGHVPSEYQGIRTKGVKGTGLAPGGDCDDENAEVSPSVIDTWYDGIDSTVRAMTTSKTRMAMRRTPSHTDRPSTSRTLVTSWLSTATTTKRT